MMSSPRQSLLAGALLLAANVASSKPLACANVPSSFNYTYSSSEVSFKVTNATHYADYIPLDFENESWNLTTTIGLPAFCRVEIDIASSNTTNTHAEVWLPDSEQWNGRLLGTGTGGVAGGVQFSDLGNNGVQIGFAAFGCDGGHVGSITDTTWGMYDADPNLFIDFSHRSLHLSTIAAKIITKQYYGHKAKKVYYQGGSTGARQGLKAIQTYPDDYDGVFIVAPPYWQTRLQVWALHTANQVQPVNGSTWLTPAQWGLVHNEIMNQCDALDGVVDGLIGDPRRCNFHPETLTCTDGNTQNCLTDAQIGAVKGVYAPWKLDNGTVLFDAYQPGGEALYAKNGFLGTSSPGFKLALNYMQYMVWNNITAITPANSTLVDVEKADELDPGKLNVLDPDMRKFVSSKGKLLHFTGWADHLIAPMNSINHHAAVDEFMSKHSKHDIDDYYRLFMVAGMAHARGGDGANYIGNNGLPYAAPYSDPQHNALMALVDWVENGVAPDRLIATKFNNDWPPLGVNFTRPVCKYPTEVVWDKKGSIWQADSFACV